MVCIYCKQKTNTTITRSSKDQPKTWRRRRCSACKAVFTSRELPDYALSIAVSQNNAQISPFSLDKLYLSTFESLSHRKSRIEDARGITDTIVAKVCATQKNGIIGKEALKRAISETLKGFDTAAYVHYTAHHL